MANGNLPPTSLLLVCTWLRKHDVHVELLDANEDGSTLHDICSRILAFDAVLCLTSSLTFTADMQVLEALKEAKADLITVIYGSHPTFLPEQSLNATTVDFALLGYPEHAILQLLAALRSKTSLNGIPALGYREKGQIKINRAFSHGGFASLPPIEYDFLDTSLRYRNPLIRHYPYVTAVTSRGCSSSCVFCTAPAFARHRVEMWSTQQVLEQIQTIVDLGYKEIYFRDETFSAFRERNREICNGILHLGIKVSWICNVKPGTTTLEDLELMKLAGCRLVKVGVESGSDHVLKQSGKDTSVNTTRRLMNDIHSVGLASHAHVMLGMPGETRDSIEETMNFVLEIEPTTLDVGICTPLPGTRLWEQLCQSQPKGFEYQGIEVTDLHTVSIFNKYYCDVQGSELERSVRRLYRRFYLRSKYLWQRAGEAHSIKSGYDIAQFGFSVMRFLL
ncbi:MAG: radical SAM protein [Anaerolineae bacterium]